MSKGIYYTKVRLYKNGKGISSEDYENTIESEVHYGEIPEAYDTKSILAEKLFGFDIENYSNYDEVHEYTEYKRDLEKKLGITINYDFKYRLIGKPRYYANFDNINSRRTVRFKIYDVFRLKKEVIVLKDWTLDKVMSRLSIEECKEFLQDNGFISKNASSKELTRVVGYIGR